jgi:hypothetical protein
MSAVCCVSPGGGREFDDSTDWKITQSRQDGTQIIPIRDYLCSILPGLADFPIKRIAEFTPGAWAARN